MTPLQFALVNLIADEDATFPMTDRRHRPSSLAKHRLGECSAFFTSLIIFRRSGSLFGGNLWNPITVDLNRISEVVS